MKPLTKDDLDSLKSIINGRSTRLTHMMMNESMARDIGIYSYKEYYMREINSMKDAIEVRSYFIEKIKEGRNELTFLRIVVENEYPQYLHMLEKLLVLK